ncbi:DNA polymerase II large subunit [archaeon]|jgi:DNA polymerase II large subunit|nr:DNA polymerase II large subunit [archaeon]MBT4648222.1 DNA polymerase II large subunit [archaeon]MBT6822272.1 DNA polymerase II large subunit [archaeon]
MIEKYFEEIEKNVRKEYDFCQKARKKGYDPEEKVDIPIAKGISERVEGLISAVYPDILGSGVANRIKALEKKYGMLDWRVSLTIAEEVAKQKFCKFKTKKEAMETAIRVGLAYTTLGVISAPLEGFIELKIRKRKDGKEYLAACFAGPIRAAGGTAAAVSLLITDYVRIKMGYSPFDPSENEIRRYAMEIRDYHERATNLQYFPSEEELEFLVKNLPIQIDGDPTEQIEVSNYKDLERIETNRIRGGMCLVLAEGLAQKAKKLAKKLNKWSKEMELDWDFINEFLKIQKKIKSKGETKKESKEQKLSPNYTYISDLVAGRPVFSLPLKTGGFRLRYGRTRTTGLACAAIHPASMHILNDYIATGTQLKVERPGKAAAIVPCDDIDGPIVLLIDGTVKKLDTPKEAKEVKNKIKNILYLGDILFNYGDFYENNHKIVPAGYCQEWWIQEFENSIINYFGSLDLEKASKFLRINQEKLEQIFSKPTKTKISFRLAHKISTIFNIPLHSDYTYYWKNSQVSDLKKLFLEIKNSKITKDEKEKVVKIIIKEKEELKSILEKIGLPHLFINKEFIVIEKPHSELFFNLINNKNNLEINESENQLDYVSRLLNIKIRDKSGTFIGTRMGRPEKAKQRKLLGSPHVIFPVGEEGGRMRSFQSALEAKSITAEFAHFFCKKCNKETIFSICENCESKTEIFSKKGTGYYNSESTFARKKIDINHYFSKSLKKIGTTIYPDLIKGVKETSNKEHIPENLVKGILRAKNNIYVNKDGTTRYDMIELPITHFMPKEIGTSVEKLKELGYETDIHGRELIDNAQMIELFPQDLILPNCNDSPDEKCENVLFNVGNFIDDVLEKLYDKEKYYNFKSPKDVIGQLVIGLAPHTSAGIVGRIIGFSKTQGMFTHPLYHAAMRRNCDGDEACVLLLMDGLLNFSRSYLPDRRGSRTMDAPLVLTYKLVPAEVDSEVHAIDMLWRYPLEFYEAGEEFKNIWDVDILKVEDVLQTERQYQKYTFTHSVTDMNFGVTCSSYKTLPSMKDKLMGQMDLAEKIVAVDSSMVASLVITKHFLKDIKGNLRKYSMQKFRCVACNEKYRRPPLIGKCTVCGGKVIFTISHGSVIKYLEPSISLATKYNVSTYLKQTLEILDKTVLSALGQEKERQEGLGQWFG